MDKIKMSVIIPTYNRVDLLIKCLDRIAPGKQTLDILNYEIIVSDDSTNDISRDIILEKYPWIKWVKGPRKGPAANRNNGAKDAKGEWLVFTDDDCLPDRTWLAKFYEESRQNQDIEAFEGAIVSTEPEKLEKGDLVVCPVNTTGGNFWSANIMVSKNLFLKVGGFDEDYFLAAQEDQQFKIDIEKHSKISFIPDCIVYHPVKKLLFKKEVLGIPMKAKNYAVFLLKNKVNTVSRFHLYKSEFFFHLRRFFQQVGSLKYRSAIISFLWLVYGIIFINYYLDTLKVSRKF